MEPSGYQNRQAKREKRLAEIEQNKAEVWDGWADDGDRLRGEVEQAIADHQGQAIEMTYRHDERRPHQPISVDDLALCLFCVDTVGEWGMSYQQVQRCFNRWDVPCHRAKVGRMKAILIELNIIEKTGGHQAGKRGTRFQRVGRETEKPTLADDLKRIDEELKHFFT